ncbi:hypothetical protein EXU85_34855 [Spirosoma sp. KCTC 42546]|uniref:hypothetical protein n=1 Tax=Spirosoma sp. KCTC 42546 TaxID=2520506 RepID=UPI001158B34B|nr:hypothetical protein [Spirosoma sp. KCTC 42546]QDK83504.1 hypothetical protein EXU85_34855 [Spirosoma sp. KCTC 42546]
MKKTQVFLMIVASLMLIDVPVQTLASTSTAKTNVSAIGRKRKGYKPRRGGLFNTGLFRKKNPCGCPNH